MNATATLTPPLAQQLATCADVHCHLLPGVDDGPETLADSVALARALVHDGVTTVITTPHQMGRYMGRNTAAQVRAAVTDLQNAIYHAGVDLTVLPGADVRIDEDLVRQIQSDAVMTLGDHHKHLLLELPHEAYFEPWGLLAELQSLGYQSILTHPERHHFVQQQPAAVGAWLKHGVILQITAGSLSGDFGPAAQRCGWQLLTQGCVSILATDAHDCDRRPPRMRQALQLIHDRLGASLVRRLADNAQHILDGHAIAVPFIPVLAARRR